MREAGFPSKPVAFSRWANMRTTTIKKKLISGFLAVVVIFALACLVSIFEMQHVASRSKRFTTEFWPTADLIMETRITFGDISATVLQPPREKSLSKVQETIEETLSTLQGRFASTRLEESQRQKIDHLLNDVKKRFPSALVLARAPGEKMEAADAAVKPVLSEARTLGSLELNTSLHEAVMAFNDYLITQDAEEKTLFNRQTSLIERHPGFSTISPSYRVFKAAAQEVFRSADELAAARKNFTDAGSALSEALRELEGKYEEEVVNPAAERIGRGVWTALSVLILALAGSAALSVIIAYRTSVGISRPFGEIMRVIKGMEQGRLDLRLSMKAGDEIGQIAAAIDEMGLNLNRMVQRIGGTASELIGTSRGIGEVSMQVETSARGQVRGIAVASAAVREILQSSEKTSKGMESLNESAAESAESLERICRNIEETAASADRLGIAAGAVENAIATLSATVEEIAESASDLRGITHGAASSITEMEVATRQVEINARETLRIVEEVRRAGELGRSAVAASSEGMGAIREESRATAEIIQSLAAHIDHIGNVLPVIEEISEQVDLLAINAAIIAAQSGEHGRGFAVVAEEIKKLSRQTRESTEKIDADVQAVKEESARAVAAIGRAERSISLGVEVSRRSGEALDQIVGGVRDATGQMQHIAKAAIDQAEGIRVIRNTIEQVVAMVDRVADATADQTRESVAIARAAGDVHHLGEALRAATHEQSLSSQTIARSAQEIEETIEKVRQACEEQMSKCSEIVHATSDIEKAAGLNLVHAGELRSCFHRLSRNADELKEETGAFTTTA